MRVGPNKVHAKVGKPVTVLNGIPGKVVENPFHPTSSGDGMFHVAFEKPKGYEPTHYELFTNQGETGWLAFPPEEVESAEDPGEDNDLTQQRAVAALLYLMQLPEWIPNVGVVTHKGFLRELYIALGIIASRHEAEANEDLYLYKNGQTGGIVVTCPA